LACVGTILLFFSGVIGIIFASISIRERKIERLKFSKLDKLNPEVSDYA
jgi:hypothetical protein